MAETHRRHFLGDEPAVAAVVDPVLADPAGVFSRVVTPDHFLKLGELFTAKAEDKQACNKQIFRITEVLQDDSKLPISRFFVSGPYGRRCSFGVVEVDMVVFLNESLPPFGNALQRIYAKLEVFAKEEPQLVATARPIRVHPFRPHNNFVRLTIDRFYFRVFAAASLGWTPEEQRQSVYRVLKKEYNSRGLEMMEAWMPALWERASQNIAGEPPEVHSFILACKYWAYVHRAHSLSPYAIEVLGYLVAKQQRNSAMTEMDDAGAAGSYHSPLDITEGGSMVMSKSKTRAIRSYRFDPLQAFQAFLAALESPESLLDISEIEPPAAFVWPWTETTVAPSGGGSPASVSTSASPQDGSRSSSTSANPAVLVDTCNPYVNVVGNVTSTDWDMIHKLANVTLHRISGKSKKGASKWETTARLTVADLLAPLDAGGTRRRGLRVCGFLLALVLAAAAVVLWLLGPDGVRDLWASSL